VTNVRLTKRAEAELGAIYDYSELNFGVRQAEIYLAGFDHAVALLTHFPRLGSDASLFYPGFRRYRYGSHYIFYSIETDHIWVHAVRHIAENIGPGFFDPPSAEDES
jgi:toxin ParE1/3/4